MSAAKIRHVNLGDSKHRLENASGSAVAWVRGHTVGINGLRSIREAVAVAPVLHRTIDTMVARRYPARHRPVRLSGALRLVHDGAYEWIAAGNMPVARVHPPHTMGLRNESLALEFVLPAFVSETVALAAAKEAAAALMDLLAATRHRGTLQRQGVR
jgi:hypothetical protein